MREEVFHFVFFDKLGFGWVVDEKTSRKMQDSFEAGRAVESSSEWKGVRERDWPF